jgi:hypothetical protein
VSTRSAPIISATSRSLSSASGRRAATASISVRC